MRGLEFNVSGWRATILEKGDLAWAALVAMFILKELVILEQLGGALHHNIPVRLLISASGTMLLLTPWARLLPGRGQLASLLGIHVALTALSFGALLHYREFGSLPSAAQLREARHLPEVFSAVISLVKPRDFLLFGDIAALLVILIVPRWDRFRRLSLQRAAVTSGLGLGCLIFVLLITSCLSKTFFGRSYIAGDLGLPGYYVWDAVEVMERRLARSRPPSPETLLLSQQKVASLQKAPQGESFGIARGRNVIFLQVESLQGFAVGLELDGQKVTPHLDALGEESLRFERFFHVTAKGRTSDAQFVSNCSLLPSTRGATVYEYETNDLYCLPSILSERGYGTHLYQALGTDFWNATTMGTAMGFERTYADRDFVMDERIGPALSDESFLRQVEGMISSKQEPFYAFVLTTTSHTPFDTEGIELRLRLGHLEGTRVGNFLHTVHYTDQAIGAFIDALRSSGLLDRSILVITGDHDAVTRREGDLQDFLPIESSDEGGWFEEERRVALMIRLPGGQLAGARLDVGSQLDLAPTLLGLLGIQRDGFAFLGSDLLGPPIGERIAVFPWGEAIGDDHVYLTGESAIGGARCFSEGRERDVLNCEHLTSRAEDLVKLSRTLLDGDMIPRVLAPPSPVRVEANWEP